MQEKEHVINLLEQAKRSAVSGDAIKLKKLSDQVSHSTLIYQNEGTILVAVIIYSLSKIIDRGEKYYKENYKKYLNHYMEILDKSIYYLRKDDDKRFIDEISDMMKSGEASKELKQNLKDIFRKARINRASKIYEHGLSMEKTAKLFGILMWELAEFTGQTSISDENFGKTIDEKTRIKMAMEFFK